MRVFREGNDVVIFYVWVTASRAPKTRLLAKLTLNGLGNWSTFVPDHHLRGSNPEDIPFPDTAPALYAGNPGPPKGAGELGFS